MKWLGLPEIEGRIEKFLQLFLENYRNEFSSRETEATVRSSKISLHVTSFHFGFVRKKHFHIFRGILHVPPKMSSIGE